MRNKIPINFGLGRLPSSDERDRSFMIKKSLTTRTSRYWNAEGWWGNQKSESSCVGFSWAHWIEDGPVVHGGIAPIVDPTFIYNEAQLVDEWEGNSYDGTSVRAGAKVLQGLGRITEYQWAFDVSTLINAILTKSPVVVGTDWFEEMFYPNEKYLIKVSGELVGGHAYVLNGVSTKTKLFRIKNSWGRDWGNRGHAYISFADMEMLIDRDGEICIGTEAK